ncbi:MAG: exodeoxyribonuclease VII large subunit [Nitrospiria bacterium]
MDLFDYAERQPPPAEEPVRRVQSVSELTAKIRNRLEGEFGDVWIEGEVSNLRNHGSGHIYLTLKDDQSQIRAVVFRSTARVLKFTPKDGQCLICRGHVTVYEPRGEYQLVLDYLEPKGAGALQLAYEQLKERLAREGLFDAARKKPLPFLPSQIAVITSPSGAVIRDFLHVVNRRFPMIPVLILPVSVQGSAAIGQIAAALDEANALSDPPDVIVLARGGGSIEDLWAFNEERVARAIARSAIPVVSAVGHETDYTIADFVADVRAPTPSAAAELIVPRRDHLLAMVSQARRRLDGNLRHLLAERRARVLAEGRALQGPARRVETALLRIDELMTRLREAMDRLLARRREQRRFLLRAVAANNPRRKLEIARLDHRRCAARLEEKLSASLAGRRHELGTVLARLNGLSPLAVLARGYSVTRLLPSGRIVRLASQVAAGDELRIMLEQGELTAEVTETRDDPRRTKPAIS